MHRRRSVSCLSLIASFVLCCVLCHPCHPFSLQFSRMLLLTWLVCTFVCSNAFNPSPRLPARLPVIESGGWKMDFAETSKSIWGLISQSTPAGQTYGNRIALHRQGVRRDLRDKMMWSHAFFLTASIYSYTYRLYELFILNTLTTFLSFFYHWQYEKPGIIAKLEGISAKLLFLYGVIQLFHAPSMAIALWEVGCLSLTLLVFLRTNLNKQLYEPYHFFMHIVPPIWTIIVSMFHPSLLRWS